MKILNLRLIAALWVLLFLLTPLSPGFAQCGEMGELTTSIDQYWLLRQQMDDHFIRTSLDENGDLLDDGIGTWDAGSLQYTKAGFSLPASQIRLGMSGGQITWGENTIKWGRYVAMLCMEYHLLKENGHFEKVKRVKNELFLALQAHRRLDMAAQRLQLMHLISTGCDPDPLDFPLSGYTGFALRDDVSWSILGEFDNNSVSECWQVNFIESDYGIYRNDCSASTPAPQGFIPTDFCDQTLQSQDMVIGALFGLSFVKRYIDPSETATVGGSTYNILSMAQNIAYGLVKRIQDEENGRKMTYKICENGEIVSEKLHVGRGDATATYYGMKKVLDYIYPGHDITATLGDRIAWRAFVNTLPLNWVDFNVRMAIELLTASGCYDDLMQDTYQDAMIFNEPMSIYHLAWEALHNDGDFDNSLRGHAFHQRVRDALCTMPCSGPCHQADTYEVGVDGPAFECNSTVGWCGPLAWDTANDELGCEGLSHEGIKFNPMSYLFTYNLFRITEHPDGFYDPGNMVDRHNDNMVGAEGAVAIDGPNKICSTGNYDYTFVGLPAGSTFAVSVSDGLSVVSQSSATVTITANADSGPQWIEFTEIPAEATDCYIPRKIQKNIEIITFHFQDAAENEQTEFCWQQEVFLDGPIGFDNPYIPFYYTFKLYMLPEGETTYVELGRRGGDGEIPNPLNITDYFENNPQDDDVVFEPGVSYLLMLESNYTLCGENSYIYLPFTYIESSFNIEDVAGIEKEEYCPGEFIFLNGDFANTSAIYCLEVRERIHGQSDFVTLTRDCASLLNVPLNLTGWLANQGFSFQPSNYYEISLVVESACETGQERVWPLVITGPLSSDFQYEDVNGVPREEFCSNEDVFINGNASNNEVRYWLEAGRAPIGSDIFTGLASGWTAGEIETINFTQWMISKGVQMTGDFVYQVKVGVQNECNPWVETTKRFILNECCEAPSWLDCSMVGSAVDLVWEDVSPNSTYMLFIDPTTGDCCGNDDFASPQGIPVAGNRYSLSDIRYKCFKWWVQSLCGDLMSAPSTPACMNSSTTCMGFGLQSERPSISKWRAATQTTLTVSPNPVKDHLNIDLRIPGGGAVRLEIFDAKGQLVKAFDEEQTTDGIYQKDWNLDGQMSAGVYIVKAYTPYGNFNQKFVVFSNR